MLIPLRGGTITCEGSFNCIILSSIIVSGISYPAYYYYRYMYFFSIKLISPPVSSVTASIDVVSAREGTFRVRCTSSGGRVLSMSVTGPGGFSEDLDNIQAVGTPQWKGNDSFSDSTDIISGRTDGQVFQCTASNGVSSNPTGSVELRGELLMHCATYSHAVTYCNTIITFIS